MRQLKVELIHPPHYNSTDDRLDPPLSLLTIASYLNHAFLSSEVEVKINDLSGVREENWEIGEADIYGITVYVTSLSVTKEIVKRCREKNPEGKIVVGGAHPSAVPESPDFSEADYVVVGEGEVPMYILIKNFLNGDLLSNRILFSSKAESNFLFPSFELIDTNSYHRTIDGLKSLPLLTSRGCPFNCFPKGTSIITSNSANKRIEKVKIGDKLIAYNNGKLVETTVTKIFKNKANELFEIEFENGKKVKCTPEHPFYVKGEWVEAGNLKVGQEIYSINFKNKLSFQKKLYNPMNYEYNRQKVSNTLKKLYIDLPNPLSKVWKRYSKYKIHCKYVNPEKWKEVCENSSKRMAANNPMKNKEVSVRCSKALKAIFASGKSIPYFRKAPKDKWHMKYISTAEEWLAWKRRDSERVKKNNPSHNPEVIKKILQKSGRHPNGEEKEALEIITNNFPGEYIFSGDGSIIIGYYNPDFVNINGRKKIIEFNGCWFHYCKICNPNSKIDKRYEHKLKSYQKYGYEVLTIWSHELKTPELLIKKIGDFTYNGLKIKSIKRITCFDRKILGGKLKPHVRKIPNVDVYNFECEPYHNYFAEYLLSHNCSFCGLQKIHELSKSVRFAYPENIWSQVMRIKAEFSIKSINFQDDVFTLDHKRLFRMTDLLKGAGIKFRCHGRAGYDTEEVYEKLSESGCVQVSWGIESGSDYILDKMNKNATVQDNFDVISWAKKYGITTRAFFVIFFPGETKSSLEETKKFIEKADPDQVFVSSMVPYPGTDVFNNPEKYGITKLDKNFENYYQVGKDGMGPLLSFDTQWLNREDAKELEIDFRDWIKRNVKFRGNLQDYEKELFKIYTNDKF